MDESCTTDYFVSDVLHLDTILRTSITANSSAPIIFDIYYTKVKVGSLPREYNLLINTGSEVSWSNSYNNCPRTSGLGVKLNFYDIGNSTSAQGQSNVVIP
ncbi:hypothetical protein KY290_036097 [Solanum tuberosum]|uniref:Peptidase A1 domain-containing protein n=1 Tax=Solanum tuberosum TaxID=4113 RepID=A0ABQ7TRR0_SOLTU|nr:hypothetical protein KY290_036097 [Solanum tuberosum]